MPPALKHLAKVGQLVEHETDAAQVVRMLEAIRQNIQDGRSATVSAETRFEAAYRAIIPPDQAMRNGGALGERLSSIKEHARAPHDFDPDVASIHRLSRRSDALAGYVPRQAQCDDYSGEAIDSESLAECLDAADDLATRLHEWLRANRSDLLA